MSSQKLVSLESRVAIVVGVVDHRPFVRETGGESYPSGKPSPLRLSGAHDRVNPSAHARAT